IGMKRGEWIVCNFWLGCRHRCQEGGLSGIWKANDPGIRDQFQPQPNPALFARQSGVCPSRRLVGGGFEMLVTEAAIAAPCEAIALADLRQIADERFVIFLVNLGANRQFEHDVGAFSACAVPPHPVVARTRLKMLLIAIVNEGIEPIDRLCPYVAATAAI